MPDEQRYYIDETGTGNTINMSHARVLQLVTDSLRYWVEEMHVDGFRFDLAATLGREAHGFDPNGGFFDAIRQDRVLGGVKLIAEPWDIGPGGYQVGNFPPGWFELNDRFRDVVRQFWKGDEGMLPELAARLTASSDLFERRGRRAWTSVNKVTSHDGFTLEDSVSYNHKHNEANGESNQDGHNANYTWNHGVEGPDRRPQDPGASGAAKAQHAGDPAAVARHADAAWRRRDRAHPARQQQRLLPGRRDQLVRLARCERCGPRADSVREPADRARKAHPVLHRSRFLHGNDISEHGVKDITWIAPGGGEMAAWGDPKARCIGLMLNGMAGGYRRPDGQPADDNVLLIVMNAYHDRVLFTLPPIAGGVGWCRHLDTTDPDTSDDTVHAVGEVVPAPARSLILFVCRSA